MNLEDLKITISRSPIIIKKMKKEDIQRFYKHHLDSGFVHPAQWFTHAMKWYQIYTFNNPYNIGRPNAELALLLDDREQIPAYGENLPLIFWGIGKGDTEMEMVNFQLENNGGVAYVIAIDINYRFLKDFANALKDKIKENSHMEVYFLGIQSLFENVSPGELNCFNTKNKLHVCLGNTIGNYEKLEDILGIFQKNVSKGDYLLLGFQSNKLIETTIKRYTDNNYLESLILSSLSPKFLRISNKEKIKWKYNGRKQQIEAWIGSVQVFRSKKFKPYRLKDIIKGYGFILKHEFKDKFTTCVHLYKYLSREKDD